MKTRTCGIAALVIVMMGAAATDATAQASPAAPPLVPRVSVSMEGGLWGGGSSADMEGLLRDAGLAETDELAGLGFLGEATRYPRTERSAAIGANIRLRVHRRISAGLSVSRSNDGTTEGLKGGFNAINYRASYSLASIAPMATLHLTEQLRIGAGPAFYRARFNSASGGFTGSKSGMGWSAQAGFAFWNRQRVFSEIVANYRGAGTISVPAVSIVQPDAFWGTTRADIPATDVSYSHWTLGVSVGFKM